MRGRGRAEPSFGGYGPSGMSKEGAVLVVLRCSDLVMVCVLCLVCRIGWAGRWKGWNGSLSRYGLRDKIIGLALVDGSRAPRTHTGQRTEYERTQANFQALNLYCYILLGILIPPSKRSTVPFSILFSIECLTSEANSSGFPGRTVTVSTGANIHSAANLVTRKIKRVEENRMAVQQVQPVPSPTRPKPKPDPGVR